MFYGITYGKLIFVCVAMGFAGFIDSIAGGDDPVGEYGKGPSEVAGKMEDSGCEDVSLLLYEGMRHEILNEFGKEAVMEDIKKFILDEECEGTADTE